MICVPHHRMFAKITAYPECDVSMLDNKILYRAFFTILSVPQAILKPDMCEYRKTPLVDDVGDLLNIQIFCLTRFPGTDEVGRMTIRFHQRRRLVRLLPNC